MLIRISRVRNKISIALMVFWLLGAVLPLCTWAADEPAAAASPAAAPVPITDADLKGVAGPSTDDLAKGDPGGALTGSVNDIVMADPKKGLTLPDLVNMAGQNR